MNIIQYWISVHTTLYFYTAIDFVYQCNLDCSKLNICQLDIFSVNIDSFLVSTLKTPNIYTEILFVHLCPSFFISLLDSALYTRESQSFKTFTKEGERTKLSISVKIAKKKKAKKNAVPAKEQADALTKFCNIKDDYLKVSC